MEPTPAPGAPACATHRGGDAVPARDWALMGMIGLAFDKMIEVVLGLKSSHPGVSLDYGKKNRGL